MLPSSSTSSLKGARRKVDSDNEMLKELIKVLCECLYRSRTVLKSGSQLSSGGDRPKKTKWFGIVSDRVVEVERLMSDWTPHLTTIVSINTDSVLTECWSFRYTLSTIESRGRLYSKLMVLVRSIITTAQALPASRNRSRNEISVRFCETDNEAYDVVPPLTESFVFPSVEMLYGRIDIQVRYRNDADLVELSRGQDKGAGRRNSEVNVGPSIVEDYIGGGRTSDDLAEEDDAENRRWKRWASESFDERERELAMRAYDVDPRRVPDKEDDEEDDEPDVPPPPSNTRASSNPMAIPTKNHSDHHGGGQKRAYELSEASQPNRTGSRSGISPDDVQIARSAPATVSFLRKSSNLSETRRDSFRGHIRASSEEGPAHPFRNYSSSFGYSVADLVAYSTTGTPIFTTLPFAVGSLASSAASVPDSVSRLQPDTPSLRTRFLTDKDFSSTSPPFPVVLMSAGSLMVSRHSSALALLDNNPVHSPSPQLAGTVTPPPAAQNRVPNSYEAALPWILTPTEMEKPFAYMGASVTLGATLDENNMRDSEREAKRKLKSRRDDDILDDDELALPFVAEEDEVTGSSEANNELGAFVRRCQEGKNLFAGQETLSVSDVKKQLDTLVHQIGLDKPLHQIHEVVTVYEERPL